MTIAQDSTYRSMPAGTTVGGPTFTGLDILGLIVAAAMLLLPLSAAGLHWSHQGWPQEQAADNR
jgi:hypothetical protein